MTLRITVALFGFGFTILGVVHTAVSSTTAAMESTDATNGCANWTAENRSCYLHMQEKTDFYKANESCEALGANLVSISSDEENQFIRKYVRDSGQPVWIGLYRTNNETCLGAGCLNWMWLDGSVAGYTQWAMGFATPGQCVYMIVEGTWGQNVPCSTQNTYVCEQKRIIPTTTSEHTTKKSIRKMTTFADSVATVDSSVAIDDSSTYIGVSVSVVILFISVSIGLGLYYIKTRRGDRRNTQTSSGSSNGTGEYDNFNQDPYCGHHSTYANGVQLNTLSGREEHAEESPAYEKVNNYSEVSPEYTCLQVASSADTKAESNALYVNVENQLTHVNTVRH